MAQYGLPANGAAYELCSYAAHQFLSSVEETSIFQQTVKELRSLLYDFWESMRDINDAKNFQVILELERLVTVVTLVTVRFACESQIENGVISVKKKPHVIFVLVDRFPDQLHLFFTSRDLLRAEINSGSENGTMIQNMIKEGKIVPSEVTVKLLQKAMQESQNNKFLIDGFPRNEENRAAFEHVTGIEPDFILFFDCPEEEMERRLLNRNQGRVDDNIETIRKRFKVFVESSLQVISYYELKGKVRKIDAATSKEEVFEYIQPLFTPYIQETHEVKVVDN